MSTRTLPLTVLILSTAALPAVLTGCADPEEELRVNRGEIEAALVEYLPKMADSYRDGDLQPLLEYTAQKEVAKMEKRIRDLLAQGRVVDATLDTLTVEDVKIWQHTNAVVSTVEVWDVRYYAAGSQNLISEEVGQVSRVKYQLKLKDGRWRILFRQRLEDG